MLPLHFLLFQSRNVIAWIARWGSESLPDLSGESLSIEGLSLYLEKVETQVPCHLASLSSTPQSSL